MPHLFNHSNPSFPVDDGTGCLPCTVWRAEVGEEKTEHLLPLGQLVRIYGAIGVHRDKRQLTAIGIGG